MTLLYKLSLQIGGGINLIFGFETDQRVRTLYLPHIEPELKVSDNVTIYIYICMDNVLNIT